MWSSRPCKAAATGSRWVGPSCRRRSNHSSINGSARKSPRRNCSTNSPCRHATIGCARRCGRTFSRLRSAHREIFCTGSVRVKRSRPRSALFFRRITDRRIRRHTTTSPIAFPLHRNSGATAPRVFSALTSPRSRSLRKTSSVLCTSIRPPSCSFSCRTTS